MISLDLKKIGATYPRLVKMFSKQIGRTIEVYVEEMLIKPKRSTYHVGHFIEMFGMFRKYGIRLSLF